MRSATTAVLTVTAAVLLAGCTSSTGDVAAAPTPSSTRPSSSVPAPTTRPTTAVPTTTAAPAALPAVPVPSMEGTCPYLAADDVAASNGEKVYGIELDPAYNPPACSFRRGDGGVQLTVWVFRAASGAQATAAVDRAAPVASTDPADQPAGWTGGSSGGGDGAVYAVAKGAVAVIVTTNQQQSVKARRVAEQVITALKL